MFLYHCVTITVKFEQDTEQEELLCAGSGRRYRVLKET